MIKSKIKIKTSPRERPLLHTPSRLVKTPFVPLSLTLLALAASTLAQSPAPEPGDIYLSEDFESTEVGQIPPGFTKTGAVGVAEDAAHGGKHSLRIEPATRGGRLITLPAPAAAALGGEHWGRLYLKVKLPVPAPVVPDGKTSAIIHSTLVSGNGISPLANDKIEVRPVGMIALMKGDFKFEAHPSGTTTLINGDFKWLYNVQPRGGRAEFATTSKVATPFTDEWTLIEWHVDSATQTYQFFANGQEVTDIGQHKGAGQFAGLEIPPSFDSLSFGWTNYQPAAGEGYTAWIDDLVLAKKRIGGNPVPETMGVRK